MSLPMVKATYLAAARACAFGISKNNNNQIAVTFEVLEGEHQGERITWIGTFTDRATEFTLKGLVAAGFQGDDLSELENLDEPGAQHMLPDSVELVCEPDTYDNETRLRVSWVNRPGSGTFAFATKLEGANLRQFAASMRGALQGMRGGTKRQSAPSGNRPPAETY